MIERTGSLSAFRNASVNGWVQAEPPAMSVLVRMVWVLRALLAAEIRVIAKRR